MSPVEAFAIAIKLLIGKKCAWSLDHSFWGSWRLDFQGSKVKLQPHILDYWFLAVWRSPQSLDWPPKRALIAWFNFDPGHKRFYTGPISDYPLTCTPYPNHIREQNSIKVWYVQNNARTLSPFYKSFISFSVIPAPSHKLTIECETCGKLCLRRSYGYCAYQCNGGLPSIIREPSRIWLAK